MRSILLSGFTLPLQANWMEDRMIFCLEDDDDIRELMIYSLKTAGFEARGFSQAPDFWQALENHTPDLLLLDVMLPGQDGLSVLQELRQDKHLVNLPVIMATAKGTEFDKVKTLDMGADDYLVKPFGMMEMLSRIKAVLRRTSGTKSQDQSQFQYGPFVLFPDTRKLLVDGTRVDLTLKEFELVQCFIRSPHRVFTRQELLDKVWGQDFLGESRTVDVHIGTLRQKLDWAGKWIKTVRGLGYQLEDLDD